MAKGKKFAKGNKDAEKWKESDFEDILNICYKVAKENPNDFLSMADIVLYAKDELGVPSRTFYYLVEKFPVLQSLKEDLNLLLIARVNKKALFSDYNATASIWRMKQLGEKDLSSVNMDHTTKGDKVESISPIKWVDGKSK